MHIYIKLAYIINSIFFLMKKRYFIELFSKNMNDYPVLIMNGSEHGGGSVQDRGVCLSSRSTINLGVYKNPTFNLFTFTNGP